MHEVDTVPRRGGALFVKAKRIVSTHSIRSAYRRNEMGGRGRTWPRHAMPFFPCLRPRGPLRDGLGQRVASLRHNPGRARLCSSADKH
jgi:hypothetical protein